MEGADVSSAALLAPEPARRGCAPEPPNRPDGDVSSASLLARELARCGCAHESPNRPDPDAPLSPPTSRDVEQPPPIKNVRAGHLWPPDVHLDSSVCTREVALLLGVVPNEASRACRSPVDKLLKLFQIPQSGTLPPVCFPQACATTRTRDPKKQQQDSDTHGGLGRCSDDTRSPT